MELFTYGTLMSPALMAAVAGMDLPTPVPATLADHAIFPVRGDVVPYIAPVAGGVVQGLVWRDLPDHAIMRLNLYENAFGYALQSVTVQADGKPRAVHVYLPAQDMPPGSGSWSLAGWEKSDLTPAIFAAQELFALDPLPAPETLRRQWPQIAARAWNRHRATAAPATLRRKAVVGDTQVAANTRPMGGFFRFQGFDISHIRFDGTRSPVLQREVFIGFDAAIVLPYDPARDRVLLLEQPRIGPLVRHDPNPWMLEAVAGIIDARETPEQAAMRETAEEARLTPYRLIPAGSYYPSPGAVSEYFYSFVALCDLAVDAPYGGGLATEGEDLRLHPMDFDAAMALADSGEITTGPLLMLLYWLARHRAELRSMG
ncbi:gamma-glutamylcyclotransferase [Yoonia sp.]|uniref:gamma-glutamylcyclotransferase n=1 Tax=Yoonia sp. TaxID=2212373 RepID=UPI00391B317E